MRTRLLVSLLALGCSPWGCSRPAVEPAAERRPSVLLISIDTLRADHLGSYGYEAAHTPRLDALAARGWRFERAITPVPLTLPAHAALMTGAFPGGTGVRDNGSFYLGDEQDTLAESLRAGGWRTGAFVGAFVLDARFGLKQGFERYFDEFDLSKYEGVGMDSVQRRGDEVVERALAWLSAEPARPFFGWVHLYDPHTPYAAPEPFRSQFPATLTGAYDAEIAWTDSQVGRLLDALRGAGRLTDTFVVVVGDHGESLGEHQEWTHGFFVYDATVHVPLIVAGPGLASRVLPGTVRLVDVMPTVLELLGLAVPKGVQGRSLTAAARGERLDLQALSESWFPRYHYGWSELLAVRDDRFTFIQAPRPELYDRSTDPGELRDLTGSDAARVERQAQALRAEFDRWATTKASAPKPVDAETAERLQALGYVGGSLSDTHLRARPRGDPKDKIGLYNQLKRAAQASVESRLDEAIALAQGVLKRDHDVLEAYTLIGNVHTKAKRHAEAAKAYRQALARDPEHVQATFSLALSEKSQGRWEAAALGFTRARELDPRNPRTLWQLADVLSQQGQGERAQAALRDGLALGGDRPAFLLKLGQGELEQRRYAEAEQLLREALQARGDLAEAHFTLALALEEQGRLDEAAREYEAELARDADAHRAAFNLGRLLLKGGQAQAAAARLRQALDSEPAFATAQLYLAKALLDLGDLQGARAAARRGLDGGPERSAAPLGHYVLADIHARQGRPRDAAREAALARRLESGK